MVEIEYDQNKACNKGRLKLFGFNMIEDEEDAESAEQPSDPANSPPRTAAVSTSASTAAAISPTCKPSAATKTRTRRNGSNSSACTQLQASRNAAVSYMRNTMVSAFAPPSHLLAPVVVHAASPSLVYLPRAGQPLQVAHGCVFPAATSGRGVGNVPYAGGVEEPSQRPLKAHSRRFDGPSLSRFSIVDDGPGLHDGFGLDLHLSLGRADS